MASKRATKTSAADEIDDLFEGITDTAAPKKSSAKTPVSAKGGKPGDDILAELENELGEKAPSRPHTPRVREAAKPTKRTGTPNPDGPRQSLEETKPTTLPRKSAESNRASFTPSATSSDLQEAEKSKGTVEQEPQAPAASTGGGWWGGILSTASAAMKQAEAAVKEIQQNEEAKKWADQMRGNVGALRGLSKSEAVPAVPRKCTIRLVRLFGGLAPSTRQHFAVECAGLYRAAIPAASGHPRPSGRALWLFLRRYGLRSEGRSTKPGKTMYGETSDGSSSMRTSPLFLVDLAWQSVIRQMVES